MKGAIRPGELRRHGGTVVQAGAIQPSIMGEPLAYNDDHCVRPRPAHTASCVIIEVDPEWIIGMIPVAPEGRKTRFGASLIGTLPQLTRG
ncbi:PAAR domain-containing protein [Piscinibacterium candidicorallinum]|uniref:PAAR domain-containing protein n=1 Tax=Piscinibacterium candidicorallinum TaxID=1793872 RepID=A0ABV7H3H0_9BURK